MWLREKGTQTKFEHVLYFTYMYLKINNTFLKNKNIVSILSALSGELKNGIKIL